MGHGRLWWRQSDIGIVPTHVRVGLSRWSHLGQAWRRLAAEGDPAALFNMGWMALQGHEVEKNGTAAYLLFAQVAQTTLPVYPCASLKLSCHLRLNPRVASVNLIMGM